MIGATKEENRVKTKRSPNIKAVVLGDFVAEILSPLQWKAFENYTA